MTIEELKAMFANGNDFQIRTGIPHTSWHNWKRMGYIPIRSQIRLESITGGELKADLGHVPEEPVKIKDKPLFELSSTAHLFEDFINSKSMQNLFTHVSRDYINEQINWMLRKLKILRIK